MRGRVISVYAMAFFGMQPLGGLLVGFVSQRAGVKNTVLAEGLIALLIGAGHLYFLSRRPILNPQAVASNQVEPLPAALAEIPVVE
jgi:hypothetical protein